MSTKEAVHNGEVNELYSCVADKHNFDETLSACIRGCVKASHEGQGISVSAALSPQISKNYIWSLTPLTSTLNLFIQLSVPSLVSDYY